MRAIKVLESSVLNLGERENQPQQHQLLMLLLPSVVASTSAREAKILWTAQTILVHNQNCNVMDFRNFTHVCFLIVPWVKSLLYDKISTNYVKFGILPYFNDLCQSEVKAAPFCLTSYGESLNRIFQEEQMNIHLTYFNKEFQIFCKSSF